MEAPPLTVGVAPLFSTSSSSSSSSSTPQDPLPAGGPGPYLQVAKAARESRKGEDYTCVLLDPQGQQTPAAFAVFDGHSGKKCAALCADILCQKLLARGPPFEPDAIVDAFWAADMEIGTTPEVRDGATATVMLVDRMTDGGLQGTFAWCGDSTAIQVDMATGSILYKTLNHMPAEPVEAARLRYYGAVRQQVEAANGIDTLRDAVTAEQVSDALVALGVAPTPKEVRHMVRAFHRGTVRIARASHPQRPRLSVGSPCAQCTTQIAGRCARAAGDRGDAAAPRGGPAQRLRAAALDRARPQPGVGGRHRRGAQGPGLL